MVHKGRILGAFEVYCDKIQQGMFGPVLLGCIFVLSAGCTFVTVVELSAVVLCHMVKTMVIPSILTAILITHMVAFMGG